MATIPQLTAPPLCRREVGEIDDAVEVGITEQSVLDLDSARRQVGGVSRIGRVRVTNPVAGIPLGGRGGDAGTVPRSAGVAAGDICGDGIDGVRARAVVEEDVVIVEIQGAVADDRQAGQIHLANADTEFKGTRPGEGQRAGSGDCASER